MDLTSAALLVSLHSLHSLAASVATFALTLIPRPIALERWYVATWFIPLLGPIAAGWFAWKESRVPRSETAPAPDSIGDAVRA